MNSAADSNGADRRREVASRASLAVVGDAVSPLTTFGEGTLVDVGALYVGSLTTVGRLTIVMTPAS